MRTSIVLLAVLLAASTADASAPKPTVASSPSATPAQATAPAGGMAASVAAARGGRLADATRLAEQVIQSGDFTPADAEQAVTFARMANDFAAQARIREAAVTAGKMDWSGAAIVPLAHRMAGDEVNAVRATERLKQLWQTRPERARTSPSEAILAHDRFKVGDYNVFALECLEQAGNFRISYIFNIHTVPEGQQAKPTDVLVRIVVEHNPNTAKVMKDLGQGDGTPKPSLDGFVGDTHFPMEFFPVEPSYAELRSRVSAYLSAKPKIEKPFGMGRWAGISCGS